MTKSKKYANTREEMVERLINRTRPRAASISGTCTYLHDAHGGCAIGAEVSRKKAEELENFGGPVYMIFHILPNRLKSMGEELLTRIQEIHDNKENWIDPETAYIGEDGVVWSDRGIVEINKLIEDFNVKIHPIT